MNTILYIHSISQSRKSLARETRLPPTSWKWRTEREVPAAHFCADRLRRIEPSGHSIHTRTSSALRLHSHTTAMHIAHAALVQPHPSVLHGGVGLAITIASHSLRGARCCAAWQYTCVRTCIHCIIILKPPMHFGGLCQ